MTSTLDTATVNRRVTSINEDLIQRVTAHLEQFGKLARSVLWTGKGSIVVHFAEPMNVTATDTRFAPLLLNWSATFRSPDGAVYLNVPAAWRRAEPEGEVDTMPMYLSLSEPQQKALRAIHGGDPFVNVPQGTLKALVADGWVVGTKEGGRILPPLALSPAGETLIFEYDVMRLNKTSAFKVGQAVQYLMWGNGTEFKHTFSWIDATVESVGKEMLTLKYADDTTGTRRAVSVRVKPATESPFAVPDAVIAEAPTEPAFNPIYCDYNGRLLRANDWVETLIDHPYPISKGSQGGVLGFKKGRVVVGFPDRVANDELAHFPEYLACNLKRIDPPAPKDDPINYDAYNGGLADAALNALVQNDIERASKADPYAWATSERRAVVEALLEEKRVYPQTLQPSSTPDVWRIEDEWKVKTMERTLTRLGVELVGKLVQDWNGDEPYCVALFKLPNGYVPKGEPENVQPWPSKRSTAMPLPDADVDSIHRQYHKALGTLPVTTQRLIQLNGDEWHAYGMDAQLLRRYAPLGRYDAVTINNRGEKWDRLVVPSGVLDELVTLANEGGLTIALASIIRDEPGQLPIREVTEIHRPNEPVQYVGKEEPPTDWETEADAEAQPEPNNFVSALIRTYFEPASPEPASEAPQSIPAPSALVMTPELQAAKIRLHIHGGLRLGRIESVKPDGEAGAFVVRFFHPVNDIIVTALKAEYNNVETLEWSRFIVSLRPKQTAPIGDVQAQADAVVSAFSNASAAVETLATALTDAQARMDEFTGAAQAADGPELLDEADEADLIEVLRLEHADIAEAALGVTQFLLNVIARLRTTATVAAPY